MEKSNLTTILPEFIQTWVGVPVHSWFGTPSVRLHTLPFAYSPGTTCCCHLFDCSSRAQQQKMRALFQISKRFEHVFVLYTQAIMGFNNFNRFNGRATYWRNPKGPIRFRYLPLLPYLLQPTLIYHLWRSNFAATNRPFLSFYPVLSNFLLSSMCSDARWPLKISRISRHLIKTVWMI